MVTRLDDLVHGAVKPRRDALKHRCAMRTILPSYACEAVINRTGECVGHINLRFGQNVDCETCGLGHIFVVA